MLWTIQRRYRRILLLAPATPLIDWVDALEQAEIPHRMVSGSPAKRAEALRSKDGGWYLMTYASAMRSAETIQPWDCVVLDESTTIKNPKAKITKWAFKKLHPCARGRAVLSGLPSPQDDMEVWTQLAWTFPDKRWYRCANYYTFREVVAVQYGFDWMVRNNAKGKLKDELHRDAFVLTRKDAGLPNIKQYKKIVQPLGPEAAAAMVELLETWEIDGEEVKHAPVVAGICHRLAGGFSPGRIYPCWKYAEVLRLLTQEFPGEKVVVWFAYNPELFRMRSWLQSKGIECVALTGTMTKPARKVAIDTFRKGSATVFLGQVACGKFGLDLSIADVEVYFSCPYSFEGRRQSEERIIHPTKKRDTLVLDLVSEGSADEAVQDTLSDRKSSATYFLSKFKERFKIREPSG
jgi:SNF2 family DNA or RNA helicase